MCQRALANTLAIVGFLVGATPGFAAEPNAAGALPEPAAETTQPAALLPVAAPAAVTAEPAEAALPRPEHDPMARGERGRVLSYIILQGLQGVGPFAGGR